MLMFDVHVSQPRLPHTPHYISQTSMPASLCAFEHLLTHTPPPLPRPRVLLILPPCP